MNNILLKMANLFYKLATQDLPEEISPEMLELFYKRTEMHRNLVKKYAKILENKFPELAGLIEEAEEHDLSKYSPEEKQGYIYTTWSYRTTGKAAPKSVTGDSWEHHQKFNDHHPEHWKNVKEMSDLALAHAVCDWCAMSEELGTSLLEWIEKEALTKWNWSPEQIKRIYELAEATGRS